MLSNAQQEDEKRSTQTLYITSGAIVTCDLLARYGAQYIGGYSTLVRSACRSSGNADRVRHRSREFWACNSLGG